MYYDDPDMMYDEYRIAKYEEEQLQEEEKQAMLTVNYTKDNNDNVNKTNNNEVAEMANDKKVAVVFVGKNGKMSKPMMAVEDVAAAVGTYWRDLYSKEDFPKSCKAKGVRIPKGKTIKNPSHVKELGVASGKLAPRATYNKIYNIRGWNSEHHRKTKALFEAAEVKYYDEANKRILTYDEAMAKNKVQDAKTIIEVKVDKPVVDKPVSLFAQAEDAKPLEIKVDLNNKVHPGFRPSDGYTFEALMAKLERDRQEGLKRLIDDLNAFDWSNDELPVTKKDDKAKALEAVRKAKQEIEAAEKLLEETN